MDVITVNNNNQFLDPVRTLGFRWLDAGYFGPRWQEI